MRDSLSVSVKRKTGWPEESVPNNSAVADIPIWTWEVELSEDKLNTDYFYWSHSQYYTSS